MKRHKSLRIGIARQYRPSSFLLSVGIASAQPTRSDTSELTLAQALSTQEREELEQLRSERRVQAQAQASWSHLSRATPCSMFC